MFRRVSNVSLAAGRRWVAEVGRWKSSRREQPYLSADLYDEVKTPFPSVQSFLRSKLPEMGWTSGKQKETVMDVGCATGMVTTEWVAPLFPSLNKVIAIDFLPNMLKFATIRHPRPTVEYSEADIEDWDTLKRWEGQMTKLVSIDCFQWLKDQQLGFKHAYQLLQPGGEAAFLFPVNSIYYYTIEYLIENSKWCVYLQEVEDFVPNSHLDFWDETEYKAMVEAAGFTIRHMSCVEVKDEMTEDDYRNYTVSMCSLVDHIPIVLRDEFKDEVLHSLLLDHNYRPGKMPVLKSTLIEIVVKKSEFAKK